jgi:predicted RNase H-like HicB family nuclease
MAASYYPAIVERAGKGYSVFFPDLPGCTSAGATLQEAARGAEEALAAHLILSAEHGDIIPAPSDIDAWAADPEVEEAARLLVRVEPPGRALRLNVTLDEGLVAAIDRVAENRSAYLAAAARQALAAGLEVGAGRKRRGRRKGAGS